MGRPATVTDGVIVNVMSVRLVVFECCVFRTAPTPEGSSDVSISSATNVAAGSSATGRARRRRSAGRMGSTNER